MALSPELKRIYASAPGDSMYIETLQISHPGFNQTNYYLTNDFRQWVFELENGRTRTFKPIPFSVVLPTHNDGGRQDLQIVIGNIGQDLMEELENAVSVPLKPIRCKYRVYLDQANTTPQNDPIINMTIKTVDAKAQEITAIATRADVLNKSFPSDIYRVDNFPGLDR